MENLKKYLSDCTLKEGKMFGVLTVKNKSGIQGELWGYSGMIQDDINLDYFTPPIYDLNSPDGYFREEEKKITSINIQINSIESDPIYNKLNKNYAIAQENSTKILSEAKSKLKEEKIKRDNLRSSGIDDGTLKRIINESQFQKAEYKRLEKSINSELNSLEEGLSTYKAKIAQLKHERKQRSAILQNWIFDQFHLLNYLGATKSLIDIFKDTPLKTPPAGAAECAAPRLLQYAYLHNLEPISLVEFWWGNSPRTEIKIQGKIYPPCKGKCGPILSHMLEGLGNSSSLINKGEDRNNLLLQENEITVLFENKDIIAVNKPSGILSVPGKDGSTSLLELLQSKLRNECEILPIHRLDMDTSGIILFAKHKNAQSQMQIKFSNREAKKSYLAILDGILKIESGEINIPLSADYINRPYQKADYESGKPAITRFEVLKHIGNYTLVRLFPTTGRTHQLRVHCAHIDGLGIPILGDNLYGKGDRRLFLHAETLECDGLKIICNSDFDKINPLFHTLT